MDVQDAGGAVGVLDHRGERLEVAGDGALRQPRGGEDDLGQAPAAQLRERDGGGLGRWGPIPLMGPKRDAAPSLSPPASARIVNVTGGSAPGSLIGGRGKEVGAEVVGRCVGGD